MNVLGHAIAALGKTRRPLFRRTSGIADARDAWTGSHCQRRGRESRDSCYRRYGARERFVDALERRARLANLGQSDLRLEAWIARAGHLLPQRGPAIHL